MKNNWIEIKLEDICITTSGGTPSRKKSSYFQGDIPWVKSGELDKSIIKNSEEHISKEAIENSSAKILPRGTLLIAMYGATVGKMAILGIEAATNQAICAIRQSSAIDTKYLYWMLFSMRNHLLDSRIGAAQPNISQSKIRNLIIPLPPFPEQHRIVAKIEELFSELDKGVESLKAARQQLKVYRQAVLKWAFEGKLTEEWRKGQKDLASVEELLEQIKKEREKKAKENGKKLKVVEPVSEEELKELPKLPDGWGWVKINELTIGVEYGTSEKSKERGKVPVLRMGNIQRGRFSWDDLVYTDNDIEIKKYCLRKNDVLFNRTNSPELVGKTAIYKGEKPAIFAGYLIRLNQISSLVNADFLNYYLNGFAAKTHGNAIKTDGVNQSNINGDKLSNYPFPYCTIEEQNIIVKEVDTRFSMFDKLEETIYQSLTQAEALRQSILKRAFAGKLVPQDPRDEPAEELLKRIRAEREAHQPQEKVGRGRTKK